MTSAEQQTEELEVLRSIFDGDHSFTISDEKENSTTTTIQYLFDGGDRDGEKNRSFLLEFRWPPTYPLETNPEFNLELFYNKHLIKETKSAILNLLNDEARNLFGSPMTYSLIEIIKDRFEQLTETQMNLKVDDDDEGEKVISGEGTDSDSDENTGGQKRDQKEKLTKAQKRKMWNRGQGNEEKPRGYNWIDVVKHLSQTGGGQ